MLAKSWDDWQFFQSPNSERLHLCYNRPVTTASKHLFVTSANHFGERDHDLLRSFYASNVLPRLYHSGGCGCRDNGVMSSFYFLLPQHRWSLAPSTFAKYTKDVTGKETPLSNTLLSPASVDSGRWWTILTSAFAHGPSILLSTALCTISARCCFHPSMNGVASVLPWRWLLSEWIGNLLYRRTKIAAAGRNDWQSRLATTTLQLWVLRVR